jgi:hypothetical protein
MEPPGLATLTTDALAEHLLGVARRARKLAVEGDVIGLHDLLEGVRLAADDASGERLALLEVAEAFLRALARADLGRSEIALRRLFAEQPHVAEAIATRLLKAGVQLSEDELMGLAGEGRTRVLELIELGVFRRVGKAFDLRPALRPLARDLLEPVVLRMWRRVHEARAQIGYAGRKPEEATAILSAQLGITQRQAEAHFATHPLTQSTSVAQGMAGPRLATAPAPTSRTTVLYSRHKLPAAAASSMTPGAQETSLPPLVSLGGPQGQPVALSTTLRGGN